MLANFIVLPFLAGALGRGRTASDVYRYVDAQGGVHYSDNGFPAHAHQGSITKLAAAHATPTPQTKPPAASDRLRRSCQKRPISAPCRADDGAGAGRAGMQAAEGPIHQGRSARGASTSPRAPTVSAST